MDQQFSFKTVSTLVATTAFVAIPMILPAGTATAGDAHRINAIIHGLGHHHGKQHYSHKYRRHHYAYRHRAKKHYRHGSRYPRVHKYHHWAKKRHHRHWSAPVPRPTYLSLNFDRSYSMAVNFKPGSSRILHSQKYALNDLGYALESRRLSGLKFIIIGHTDAAGSRYENFVLSKRRAHAVRNYLLSRFSISPRRLVAIGFGEERLLHPHRPYASSNRRVEVAVLTPELEHRIGRWLDRNAEERYLSWRHR